MFLFKISFIGKKIYNFFNRKWFFDKIYTEYFGQFFFKFGYSVSYKFIDRGVFELLGPTGLSFSTTKIASELYRLQSGYIYHYTYSILVSITFLLCLREAFLGLSFSYDSRIFLLFLVSTFFVKINVFC